MPRPFSKYFIKPGPYETNFKERVTKVFMVNSGTEFSEIVKWVKSKMGVKE